MTSLETALPRSIVPAKRPDAQVWVISYQTRLKLARAIVLEVARNRKIGHHEITGPGRMQYLVNARKEACLRIYREVGLGTPTIGMLMGRDSTTIRQIIKRAMAT